MVVDFKKRRKKQRELAKIYAAAAYAVGVDYINRVNRRKKLKLGWRGQTRARKRISMREIFYTLGPEYFRRSFRMGFETFKKLARILEPKIRELSRKEGSDPSYARRAPNGLIEPSQRLGCFLRHAAGGHVYDIMLAFGIGRADVSKSIWIVVDAINQCEELALKFPEDHDAQRAIADGFYNKSSAGFRCCAGAVDGILIWTQRPSENDAALSKCSVAKFFCGRKHKYGLNCQAICDSRGRFLDVSVMYPASTSDTLSFESATIYGKLEQGLLAPGEFL